MATHAFSFIDIVVLDQVRKRFARGGALLVLSAELEEIIWANGAGAALLGFADFESAIGGSPALPSAARRQIMATRGYPLIGEDRKVAVRLPTGTTNELFFFSASAVSLPDGATAILLAAIPPQDDAEDDPARAIAGLAGEGQMVALLDAAGQTITASGEPDDVGLSAQIRADLAAQAAMSSNRLLKRMVDTARGKVAVGLARIEDAPGRYLLMAVADLAQQGEVGAMDEPVEAAESAAAADTANEAPVTDDPWYFNGTAEAGGRSDTILAEAQVAELPAGPIRFVWRTDENGRFSMIGEEFAELMGLHAGDVVGRPFEDVARAYGFDPTGEIADLLRRRDTWSGRTVLWPVAGTDLRVPLDLAALPAYDRDRNFQGFRGFGVARPGDAETGPEVAAEPVFEEAPAPTAVQEFVEPPQDPFKGEVPALDIAPGLDRRFSDKVVRLAEHRPAAERELSNVERLNFREIGRKLRDSGIAARDAVDSRGSVPTPTERSETQPAQSGIGETALDAVDPQPVRSDEAEHVGIGEAALEASADAAWPTLEPVEPMPTAMAQRADDAASATVMTVATASVVGATAPNEPAPAGELPQEAQGWRLDRNEVTTGRGAAEAASDDVAADSAASASVVSASQDFAEAAPEQAPPSGHKPAATASMLSEHETASSTEPEPAPPSSQESASPDTATLADRGDEIRADDRTADVEDGVEKDARHDTTSDANEHAEGDGVGAVSIAHSDAHDAHPISQDTDLEAVETPLRAENKADEDSEDEPGDALAGTDDGSVGESHAAPMAPEEAEPFATEEADEASQPDSIDGTSAAHDEAGAGEPPAPKEAGAAVIGDANAGDDQSLPQEGEANAVGDSHRMGNGDAVDAGAQAEPDRAEKRNVPLLSLVPPEPDPMDRGETGPTEPQPAQPDMRDAEQAQSEEPAIEPAQPAAPASEAPQPKAPSTAQAKPDPRRQRVIDAFLPSAFAGIGREIAANVDTTLLSRLPLPVLVHSGDALHYANREFLQLTGHSSLDALERAGGLDALFAEPYRDGGNGDHKLCLRRADGAELPVDAFLQSVSWGGGKALLLALRPAATEQPLRPAEPATDAQLDELRAIMDTATDGIIIIDNDGHVRSISRPAEALFGMESADVAGRPFESLLAIESQRAAREYLAGLAGNGVASVLNDGREVIGREAQGRFIPLFMTIGRLPNHSGYCAVVRDITSWKRAEEELTQARAQAERASSQKTDFLARVSHEIRTPLNAIIGFSELMVDEKFGPISNERYRDYLRDINRSGNHVLDLVNDLLDISKIEAGEQELNYEAVSLNDTLGETVAMMQPQANRERVIIRSSFASRLPDVVADLRSVRQIALNLFSNAIRYTQAGGQVIVSTSYETNGDVVMRVRDTGVGMSGAELEQAMKPFKQVNALKRPRGDGTGLGLPLTKAMVEANRARFTIHSTPGEGTLVEVVFPSARVLAH